MVQPTDPGKHVLWIGFTENITRKYYFNLLSVWYGKKKVHVFEYCAAHICSDVPVHEVKSLSKRITVLPPFPYI